MLNQLPHRPRRTLLELCAGADLARLECAGLRVADGAWRAALEAEFGGCTSSVCTSWRAAFRERADRGQPLDLVSGDEAWPPPIGAVQRLWAWVSWQPRPHVVLTGLDAAGKTTLQYVAGGFDRIPCGWHWGGWEEFDIGRRLHVLSFDAGGQPKIRPLLKHLLVNARALAFVVDARDAERLDVVRDELAFLLSEHAGPVLVLANKQDLPGALTPRQLVVALRLPALLRRRVWACQGTCMTRREGVGEAVHWLERAVR